MGLFWFRPQQSIRTWIYRLNPRFDGAFLIPNRSINITLNVSLNPRFDGAFLIHKEDIGNALKRMVLIPDLMGLFWFVQDNGYQPVVCVLIPDLMGLFWFRRILHSTNRLTSLNPRFDGAFLIRISGQVRPWMELVLIPDLMGLFWFLNEMTRK